MNPATETTFDAESFKKIIERTSRMSTILKSNLTGQLSPRVFHKSLENIQCNGLLYPHIEEGIFENVDLTTKLSKNLSHGRKNTLLANLLPVRAQVSLSKADLEGYISMYRQYTNYLRPPYGSYCGRLSWNRWSYISDSTLEAFGILERTETLERRFLAGSYVGVVVLLVLCVLVILRNIDA